MNRQDLLLRIGEELTRDGKVHCPVHDDHHASLAVREGENGLLLKCWSCDASAADICAAWGIKVSDLFYEPLNSPLEPEAVYDYGTYEVVRSIGTNGKKTFRQRRKVDGEYVWNLQGVSRRLYRQEKVEAAAAKGDLVVVVEGEKDVHTVERLGYVATTNSGGAEKWDPRFSELLLGARVAILPDNDPKGRAHAQRVFEELEGRTPVHIVELPGSDEKDDVSDWLPRHSPEELEVLIDAAFQPQTKARCRADVLASALAEIQLYQEGGIVGMPWPMEWPTVSRVVGPLVPGVLTVIGAKTSHGKSIAAQQIARHVCQMGKTVLMVTLELTPERLIARELGYLGADLKRLRTKGGMIEVDFAAIARFQKETPDYGEQWYLTVSTVEEIDHEVDILRPDIVIIDYLHRMHANGKDEYHSITNNMNDIQDMTLRRCVPVVILSQLRRPGERDEFKRPHMSDLRGSGAIEERAATIILLQRRYEKSDDDPDKRVKTDRGAFFIEKNADGEADRQVNIVFRDGRFEIREEL